MFVNFATRAKIAKDVVCFIDGAILRTNKHHGVFGVYGKESVK
jgi:hypothetical protein